MQPLLFHEDVAYTKANGQAATAKVPLVDLPAGTLLFRGVKLPDVSKGEDARMFLRDFLGYPEGGQFCLTPTHNVFFYPIPFVPFGAHTVGEWFNAIQIYVTVKPVRVVSMVAPSKWIRGGDTKKYDGTAPLQRCHRLPYSCKAMTAEEKAKNDKLKQWDNCIRPEYAVSAGVNGWMAMTDLESLDMFDEKPAKKAFQTTMGKYLLELEGRIPGKMGELLPLFTTDNRRHRGIPEIVLFPWGPHPGPTNQVMDAANEDDAVELFLSLSDSFNFLPVACITEKGVLEAFSGDFKASDLPGDSLSVAPGPATRASIDTLQDGYLTKLKTDGVDIPDLGKAKMMYDTRTGFFVLDLLTEDSYKPYLLPLSTPAEKLRATECQIVFRTFFPRKHMTDYTLTDGSIVKRAYMFERPPLLRNLYTDLGKDTPPYQRPLVGRSAGLFQSNKKGGTRKIKKIKQKGGEIENAINIASNIESVTEPVVSSIQTVIGPAYKNVWKAWVNKRNAKL